MALEKGENMNKVLMIGRLGKDLELSKTQSGKTFCKFQLAVNDPFNKEHTNWINCVVWDRRAETMYQYLRKGSQVGIEGRIQTGSYEDRETGKRVYTTDVIVENFTFLESRKSESNTSVVDYNTSQYNSYSQEDTEPSFTISDEDLPF